MAYPRGRLRRCQRKLLRIQSWWSPRSFAGQLFDSVKVLLDPYARGIFLPPDFSRAAATSPGPNDGKAPLAILPAQSLSEPPADDRPGPHTHDLIIYKMHVRNFTNDPSPASTTLHAALTRV